MVTGTHELLFITMPCAHACSTLIAYKSACLVL